MAVSPIGPIADDFRIVSGRCDVAGLDPFAVVRGDGARDGRRPARAAPAPSTVEPSLLFAVRRDSDVPRNVDIDVVRGVRGVHDHHARNVDGVLTYG